MAEEQGFRRQSADEMWVRDENDDNDAATNDFASLEAMLASQTSGNGTVHNQRPKAQQHNDADDVLHAVEVERHSRNQYYDIAPPSSPSTLSNDSVAVDGGRVSPQKKKKQQQLNHQPPPPRLHNFRNEPDNESKSRMHPPASTLSPPPSRTNVHHEKLNSRQRPPKKTPTVEHTAKSIVGSRPRHWGAAATVCDKTTFRKKSGKSSVVFLGNSRKRKAVLAAELHKSALVARSNLTRNSFPPRAAAAVAVQDDHNNNRTGVEQLAAADAAVSFAPSFFSPPSTSLQTSSSVSPTEAIADTIENSDDTVTQQLSPHPQSALAWTSPTATLPPQQWMQHPHALRSSHLIGTNSSPYSPPARKSSSSRQQQQQSRMGPLRKRLQAIRSAVDGDVIRLQSGQYSFSLRRSMDRNDPRNRATTVCDLTILGHCVPWSTAGECSSGYSTKQQQQQCRLVTVLSYVHSWTQPLVRSFAATNSDTSDDNTSNNGTLGLVWAVFTHDKAREQSLGNGTQLRVYNAICIPAGDSGSSSVKKMMLCTNLCEPYPSSVLPPLPDVSATITGSEAMAST